MKVLLISANTLNAPYPVYPLGLDYVSAALRPKHTVEIADLNVIDANSLIRLLTGFRPQAVGISLRNIDNTDITAPRSFIDEYRQLIRMLRRHTRAPIVLGGAGFSIFPEKLLKILQADYGIVGEGERMADLLEALQNDGSAQAIPGVLTPTATFPPPSHSMANPPRNFDSGHTHLPYYLNRGGMLNLQTKRGCPFNCVYCTYPRIEGRRFRLMDPVSVGRTARELQEAGARYLFIADSVFNGDIAHSLAVAQQFRQQGVSIPWGAFLAPMKMPSDYFSTMKDAGLKHVEFGTESLSDSVLKAYGKPFRRRHVMAAHQNAVQEGLHVAHYFLLGGPGETAETLCTTLSHIDNLKRSVLFLFCGMRVYPDTELHHRAAVEGAIRPTQDLLEPMYYQSPSISRDEILRQVETAAGHRTNWIIGSGGHETADLLQRMHQKGYAGPLWEYLIR